MSNAVEFDTFINNILRNVNKHNREYRIDINELGAYFYEKIKNKSYPTQKFVKRFLSDFLEYMYKHDKLNISTQTIIFTKDDLYNFIIESNKEKSYSRLDKYITYSNMILKFVNEHELLNRSEIIDYMIDKLKYKHNRRETRKTDKELLEIIINEFDKLEKLIESDATISILRSQAKYILILTILYMYGLRTTELKRLNIKEMLNTNEIVVIRSKTYRSIRQTVFPNIIQDVILLADELGVRKLNVKNRNIYKKKKKQNIDFRDFRRNFSQRLYKSNKFTIEEIEYLMGHSTVLFTNYLQHNIVLEDLHNRFKQVFAKESNLLNEKALNILKMLNTSV